MSDQGDAENSEQKKVAASSVLAAVLLTATKLAVGLFTGSLGILSEALHSALDLLAAAMTWFAVHISGKPADRDPHGGRGTTCRRCSRRSAARHLRLIVQAVGGVRLPS
jgi:Co/Zn/Cd efflux system component